MKGAKELAGILRHMRDHLSLDDIQKGILRESAAHLDRLAAIDSAATGEVGEIARRFDLYGMCDADAKALLAIVQRQAGEIAALKQEHFAATLAIEQTLHDTEQRSDAARAEVEKLRKELGR